ncbi:MAG: hypothetical protein OHK006_00300 [Thermodesulfovibrionales bacterium]
MLACLCVFFAGRSDASPLAEAEAFEKAYELYLSNQYEKAVESFDRFLADYPLSSAADSVYFWKAKSLLNLKKDEEARQLFTVITKRFPDSPYRKIAEREMVPRDASSDEGQRSSDDASRKQSRVVVVGSQEKKIKGLEDERDALRQQVSELSEKILQNEKAAADAARQRDESERGLKAKIAELESRNRDLGAELAALKKGTAGDALRRQPDARVVQVNGKAYTASDILRMDGIAARVLAKLQPAECAWRGGGAVGNFVRERQILAFAASRGISADAGQVASLSRRHALSPEETDYLADYLAIERAVRMKLAESAPGEQELRKYYEANRDSFRKTLGTDPIHVVALRYDAQNEVERGALAVDIRNEALRGGRLEDIAQSHPESVFQVRKVDDLPTWARARVGRLKDGELSDVIATEQEYLVLMLFRQQQEYRSFEEARSDIAARLRAARPAPESILAPWYAELAKDFPSAAE